MIKKFSKYSMGATAAILTSMGLIAGLAQGDSMKNTTIAGLLIVAIVDNISDSLGIHIYKESEGAKRNEIISATYGNFITRILIVFSFIFIVLFLPAVLSLIISSIWGIALLVILSLFIAKAKKTLISAEILWHVSVAVLIIVGCKVLGTFIYGHIL